ncbi:uncharacterized protein LOC9640177 [Selaginella moellendorffii]|nr:uncharacterized protein LOC9640177 [Selaginella moellendorffii]|eukprot:XP_002971442.2 uncharacterized protein LOC9640177 [Selaginella moellendorffii]
MGTRVADDRCYLVAHYTSVWSYLWPHISHSLDVGSVNLDWRARFSLFMLWSVRSISQPLKHFGRWVEKAINICASNGGILRTLYTLSMDPQALVDPSENSESYLTFNGHMEPRISLLQAPSSQRLCLSCPDSKAVADVCAMASKVAYENPKFIEFVVNQNWKMHLLGTYNCWNEFQKNNSTQAFIFADRETDAGAIVLAFRGTEAFNAYDWCTDLDFSWYELPQLGRVHLGFLEALGLGDRNRMQSFQRLKQNIYENSRTPLSQTPTSGLPDFVLSDETKLLAYDHISAELVTILRKHRNAKLYITGHSLGGALATLFTAMLFYNREENRVFYNTEDDVARRLVALYTFGQPRVGDKSFASFMDTSLNKPTMRYFRVVYNNDMVARVPFDNSLFGFKHFGNCCYFTYNYTLQILPDEPFRNFFSPVYMVLSRLYALFELVQSFFMSYRCGGEFSETRLSTVARIAGLLVPGIAGHSLVNYINCVRLGPDHLDPACLQNTEWDKSQ